MLNVTKELTALARKLGYTGKAPDTVAKAINAITSVAGSSSGDGVFIIETEEIETGGDKEGKLEVLRLNKTWKEIDDALMKGKNCIVIMQNEQAGIIHCLLTTTMANSSDSQYIIMVGPETYFYASSENDYPTKDL